MKKRKTDDDITIFQYKVWTASQEVRLNKTRILFLTKLTNILSSKRTETQKINKCIGLLKEEILKIERDVKKSELQIYKLSKHIPGVQNR